MKRSQVWGSSIARNALSLTTGRPSLNNNATECFDLSFKRKTNQLNAKVFTLQINYTVMQPPAPSDGKNCLIPLSPLRAQIAPFN
ncbi:hypothetical protein D3C81_1106750 [compost metagenome]